jgi:hypothetical protein
MKAVLPLLLAGLIASGMAFVFRRHRQRRHHAGRVGGGEGRYFGTAVR